MSAGKVLVIEDDRSLADVLRYNLQQVGYDVLVAYDGQDGLTQAQLKQPDVVILDIMLPVIDGHEVCRRMRADSATGHAAILMLTARAEESDELVGLTLGADDYVTKPFSVKVLLERIKALTRRRRSDVDSRRGEETSLHGVTIDRRGFRASADGHPLQLTRSEFRLLDTLIRQPGRVFKRAELIEAALGEDTMVLDRTIDVHIRALRRKLGNHSSVIETVRGVGYRYRE